MAHHVFGHEDRVENLAVVDVERQANKIRRNHRTTGPGFDRRLGLGVPGLLDLVLKVKIYKWSFFNGASHNYLVLIGSPLRRTTMNRFEYLYFGRVFPPLAILPQGDINCCQPPPD